MSHPTYRLLDQVPTRGRRAHSIQPARVSPVQTVSYPTLQISPSLNAQPESESYSPTASDIDALEESFLELDIKSTITEGGTKSSSHDASSKDRKAGGNQVTTSLPSPSSSLANLDVYMSGSIETRLPLIWPKLPKGLEEAPWAVAWEITRVALECEIDTARLILPYSETWTDQDTLWAALKTHRAFKNLRLPPKSDPRSWRLALSSPDGDNEAVLLVATLYLTHTKVGPPMRIALHPLKRERSSRLFRRFGSHRVLEVHVPAVESWPGGGEGGLEGVAARWLARGRHGFLGRRWAGFYVRERPLKVDSRVDRDGLEVKALFYDRVLLFAEDGRDLNTCERNNMLDWLLNLDENGEQSYLKLFHRVSLGLSQTTPITVLEKHQIRHRQQNLLGTLGTAGEAMNDGAARISPTLMKKVRDAMGLQTIPTAIQGRLGSSKGMWLLDPSDTSHEAWIETFPSQRKWHCNEAEDAHRTLEFCSWSAELSPASLNIQFLPILEDRAPDPQAMRATFVRNMSTEAEAEIETLKQALQHPPLFRKWARDNTQSSPARLTHRAVPFLAGLPDTFEDTMAFLADGGFAPLQLQFLQDLVFQAQKTKGDAMKAELRIRIARSTYAYMLPDFWGVLEAGEVHLAFSGRFGDGEGGEVADLDGVDVLVGRSPAHLPSDIQKVRAVFRPALRHLRDVVVFSTRGEGPLAALLSGGDYDGDKAWVCWDRDIVDNFRNHPLPQKPDLSPYLGKDTTTLVDLRRQHGEDDYINAMIEKAFHFNLQPKLLGPCTSYKEKLCYNAYPLSNPISITLSWLLSDLADQPKQGVLFSKEAWDRLRATIVGNRRPLIPPAYKTGALPQHTADAAHIIDYLMCTAKRVVDAALTDLHQFLRASRASSRDCDVEAYWDHFEASQSNPSARGRARNQAFLALREGLRKDVDKCYAEWKELMSGGVGDYREKVAHVYASWRAIAPRALDPQSSNLNGGPVMKDFSTWELLKASWAFRRYHQKRFVWQMAGRQLQALKAMSVRRGEVGEDAPVVVVAGMYASLKPDNTYIKRLVALDGDEAAGVEDFPAAAVMADLVWGANQE